MTVANKLPDFEEATMRVREHHRVQEDSILRQLMRADIDETVSKTERFPAATTTFEAVRLTKTKMSNVISGQISKVRQKLDHADKAFTVSIGHFHANNGDVLICCAVTRTA